MKKPRPTYREDHDGTPFNHLTNLASQALELLQSDPILWPALQDCDVVLLLTNPKVDERGRSWQALGASLHASNPKTPLDSTIELASQACVLLSTILRHCSPEGQQAIREKLMMVGVN